MLIFIAEIWRYLKKTVCMCRAQTYPGWWPGGWRSQRRKKWCQKGCGRAHRGHQPGPRSHPRCRLLLSPQHTCGIGSTVETRRVSSNGTLRDKLSLSSLNNCICLPSSCHHTSCQAHPHPHSCCRTSWRSWRPPQCRDKPQLPAGPLSTPAA